MESIEIDIKIWMGWEGGEKEKEVGGAGKKKKQAQGDAHSSSHGECLSKQCLSLEQVPAEQ